jgi:large subunit ribosomal protein L1
MNTHGKKYRAASERRDQAKAYDSKQAIALVKGMAFAKFDETVEVAIRLGVDPRHADQVVRGTVVLPAGTGKTMRVLVIAAGAKVQEAQDQMGQLGQLGRVLGPRGLMPNPKAGTVTFDVAKAVRESKGGKIEFRVDKGGNVHAPIGKVSFTPEQLESNFTALLDTIVRAKPAAAKGVYIRNVAISSSMGPGVTIDTTPFR